MKICFFIANISGRGGTERVTSLIANGLAEKNFIVEIVTCQGSEKSFFPLRKHIKVLSLHSEEILNPVLRMLYNYKSIWKIAKKRNYDVVIAVDVSLFLYVFPLQFAKKCKCIAWEHFNYYISSSKYTKFARRLAVKYAEYVIVLGKNDLKNYLKFYPKAKKITYIYNPVAFEKSDPENIDKNKIIAVGRLTKQKGFDLLIEAWNIIEKKKPNDNWVLNIYGEGEMKDELWEKINKYQLKRCRLKGYTKDIEIEMKKSSIFVLSSRYEGFVLVLLEAQSKGLPCVSFNCKEGPAEIIEDGINGFLAEEGNVKDLAQKLQKLMYDDVLRKRFSENAQKDLERFDTKEVIKKWEDILKLF